jgi:hypothetical protein
MVFRLTVAQQVMAMSVAMSVTSYELVERAKPRPRRFLPRRLQ